MRNPHDELERLLAERSATLQALADLRDQLEAAQAERDALQGEVMRLRLKAALDAEVQDSLLAQLGGATPRTAA